LPVWVWANTEALPGKAGSDKVIVFLPFYENYAADVIFSGAETFYRHQIMLQTRAMSALSRELARIIQSLALPEDVTLAEDIDAVNLG
jgi:hypothetical protein